LHGEPEAGADPSGPGRLGADLPSNGQRQDYMRARLSHDREGILVATPSASQDSSLVKTMAEADGLIVRPPRALAAKAGEACRIIAFEPLGI
jgi:molybdopterin molybdotransferase